ncbi:Mitochondrial carrier domain-containing protein [Cynara cardunculus var. scolymus]|uniref:Mitochondrial carrier domain-containing protein n=1 Tax=Cynara cardunculus var. scolymus TaxID=59895 RepID=A0A103Y1W9_CYNCS|nr:Mitochondrial carrier domain-containing protein [Cynara cardunculus var. scolymus]
MNDESDNVMATSNVQGGNANMQSEETSTARRKKRKRRVDPMADGFSNAVTKLGETLEKMANKLSRSVEREDELDNKRSMITPEILKMQTLAQREKFKAISLIRDDPEKKIEISIPLFGGEEGFSVIIYTQRERGRLRYKEMGDNSGYKHYIAGLVSGVSMVIVGHPFDTVKCFFWLQHSEGACKLFYLHHPKSQSSLAHPLLFL